MLVKPKETRYYNCGRVDRSRMHYSLISPLLKLTPYVKLIEVAYN